MMRAALKTGNRDVWSTIQKPLKRHVKTVACPVGESAESIEENIIDARPPEEIPGPKSLPLIGNVFRFLPYIGKYGHFNLMEQLRALRDDYGDIVRLTGIPNKRPSVLLFNPELIETVYRQEGQFPLRYALECLVHYCENRQSIYKGRNLLVTSQGKNWYDFRSKVNPHMMQPRSMIPHISQTDSVSHDFIEKIRNELRDPVTLELPSEFYNQLNQWALESICVIAINHRLGCLKSNLPKDSEPQIMIQSVQELFNQLYYLECVPSWNVINKFRVNIMSRMLDNINEIMMKYIIAEKEKLNAEPKSNQIRNRSILEKLLEVDEEIACMMAVDMINAGIDTTSNASGSFLYHLATNQRVQDKLREEAFSVLPNKSSPVTEKILKNVSYLKACFKENMRLSPITIGTVRNIPTDIVISGYRIPKEWSLMPCHGILAQAEDQFARAKEFIPERWMRDNQDFSSEINTHPFAYMPFGFGPRSCIGRRVAEMEIQVFILKMVRNFRIEWHHEPLKYKSYLINTIASPMKFKLIDL